MNGWVGKKFGEGVVPGEEYWEGVTPGPPGP